MSASEAVYSVTEAEAEWSDRDREEAEGLLVYEATKCPGCGNDLNDSLTDDFAWDVNNETVCRACAALEHVKRDEQEEHREDKQGSRPGYLDGRIYHVHKYLD